MTKALVIGAGIAGPVTAAALRKAGIEAAVFEAADRTADGVGAFLTLAVNGLAALETLDLKPMLDGGFDTPRMVVFSGTGRRLADLSSGPRLPDGTVSQTIRRCDLYVSLRDEVVRRGVPVHYGRRLVDAEVTSGGTVVARFADGSEAEGDLRSPPMRACAVAGSRRSWRRAGGGATRRPSALPAGSCATTSSCRS